MKFGRHTKSGIRISEFAVAGQRFAFTTGTIPKIAPHKQLRGTRGLARASHDATTRVLAGPSTTEESPMDVYARRPGGARNGGE